MQKQKHRRTKKKYQKKKKGGNNLAYPYKGPYLQNPALAYKGSEYPSPGPKAGGFNFLNSMNTQYGGHSGSSYPNGLVGAPYNNPTNLPGISGIGGNANYYKYNENPTLQTMSLKNIGANPPFLKGGGYKRRVNSKSKKRVRGGAFSNSLGQELLNLGRSVPFTLNSAYNGMFGYAAPQNPSPLAGQFPNSV